MGVTGVSGALAYVGYLHGNMWDAAQLYIAGRAILSGRDPYAAVAASSFPWPLFYPLPAVLLFLPFACLPIGVARVMWGMAQGFLLGLAARRHGLTLLIAALSASFFDAQLLGQWSPALTAAAVVPGLGLVWAAKPTIGLALFVAFPSRAAALGVALITGASLLAWPSWPGEWVNSVAGQVYLAPVLRPGGVILLLALLQWRRPEGRLVGTLALMPHTTSMYELLPLFLVARQRWQAYLLAALTYVALFAQATLFPWLPGQPLEQNLAERWPVALMLVYLPALLIVLTERRRTRGKEASLTSSQAGIID